MGEFHLYILDSAAFAFGVISDEIIAKASVMGGRGEMSMMSQFCKMSKF